MCRNETQVPPQTERYINHLRFHQKWFYTHDLVLDTMKTNGFKETRNGFRDFEKHDVLISQTI